MGNSGSQKIHVCTKQFTLACAEVLQDTQITPVTVTVSCDDALKAKLEKTNKNGKTLCCLAHLGDEVDLLFNFDKDIMNGDPMNFIGRLTPDDSVPRDSVPRDFHLIVRGNKIKDTVRQSCSFNVNWAKWTKALRVAQGNNNMVEDLHVNGFTLSSRTYQKNKKLKYPKFSHGALFANMKRLFGEEGYAPGEIDYKTKDSPIYKTFTDLGGCECVDKEFLKWSVELDAWSEYGYGGALESIFRNKLHRYLPRSE